MNEALPGENTVKSRFWYIPCCPIVDSEMREALPSDCDEFFAGVESDDRGACLVEELFPVARTATQVTDSATGGGGPLADSVLACRMGDVDVT